MAGSIVTKGEHRQVVLIVDYGDGRKPKELSLTELCRQRGVDYSKAYGRYYHGAANDWTDIFGEPSDWA